MRAVVTGGTSGIGLAIVKQFSEKGAVVYALARREAELPEGVTFIPCDVTDEASCASAVETILSREGRIDVLVNNAGFGISGAVEFTELKEAKRQFDVNFFGMVNMTKAVLPSMRENGGGRVINMSSVAAITPIPYQTYYSASKAAINAYTMALQNEVRGYNIKVSALMPGDVKTGFTATRAKSMAGSAVYPSLEKSVRTMEHDEQNGMSPVRIAKKIYSQSQKRHPKPLCTVGLQYKFFAFLQKVLPASFINRLVGMIYS